MTPGDRSDRVHRELTVFVRVRLVLYVVRYCIGLGATKLASMHGLMWRTPGLWSVKCTVVKEAKELT